MHEAYVISSLITYLPIAILQDWRRRDGRSVLLLSCVLYLPLRAHSL